jgi:hypothetical protein
MLNCLRWTGLALPALVMLGGCGSSTAPSPTLTAAQVARHIDSLAAVADPARRNLLSAVELLPAYGATPVSVYVTTGPRTEKWQGFVMEIESRDPAIVYPDSTFTLLAYSDYALTNVLAAQIHIASDYQGSETEAELLADSVLLYAGSGSLTAYTRGGGSSCTFVHGLTYVYPFLDASCELATFTAGLTWTFPQLPGVSSDLLTITIQPQSFHGIIVNQIE